MHPSAIALAALFIVAVLPAASGQPAPQIVRSVLEGQSIHLEWTGGASSYEVQTASELPPATWIPILSTGGTNASIPLTNRLVFFRVAIPGLTPIPPARRLEVLNSISAKAGTLPGNDPALDNRQLAQFLSGIPELRDVATTSDGCVWAEFTDGRLLTLVRNRASNSEEPQSLPARRTSKDPGEAEARAKLHDIPAPAAAPNRIPKSDKAFLLTHHSLGTQLYHPVNWQTTTEMKNWFSDKGYETTEGDSTVAALSAVRNAGVFYYEGHTALRPDRNRFIIVTATTLNDPLSPEFLEDLHYALILNPRAHSKAYYSVTPDFIRKHMSFSADSLVFINGCTSATSKAEELHQALFTKGASVLAGWTDSAGDLASWRAARYLFDRLLGANSAYNLLRSPDFGEDPPQRPFDLPAVLRAMQEHPVPLDQTQVTGQPVAQLAFLPNPASETRFGMLVPSIARMSVDERKEELQILGSFDPGMQSDVVVTAGTKINLTTSNPISEFQIAAHLPADGQPSAGEVRVLQDGRVGNSVPLSEWRVKARIVRYFSVGVDQPSATFEFDLHFRTDVHSNRQKPHGPSSFAGNVAAAARDSTCRLVDASGIYHDPDEVVADPEMKRTVEWQLPSPLNIPFPFDNFQPVRASGSLSIQPDGSINLIAAAAARDAIVWIEKRHGQSTTSKFDPAARGFSPEGRNGSMDLVSFVIQGGQGTVASDTGKLTWESSTPKFPPDKHSRGYGE